MLAGVVGLVRRVIDVVDVMQSLLKGVSRGRLAGPFFLLDPSVIADVFGTGSDGVLSFFFTV